MNLKRLTRYLALALLSGAVAPVPAATAAESLPDSEPLMRALADEITRSMGIQMEDLEKPYFIQFTVADTITYRLSAAFGDITSSDRDRSRDFQCQVRVGSYELDNTNFSGDGGGFGMFSRGGGGGRRASLPLDEDYSALRQAIWWAADNNYKNAVETLTKKRAYMKDKNIADRPNDFSKASVVEHVEKTATLDFDRAEWENKLRKISAQFNKHQQFQDSEAQLLVAASNDYVVNTEGTRLRTPDGGALLIVKAEMQAEDGMKISDGLSYFAHSPQGLPAVEEVLSDIDEMAGCMAKVAAAPLLEQYTGPVLFDHIAAAQVFRTLMAEGVAGRPDPVGTQRRRMTGGGSLEKKLGQRILPRSFQVYDDPTVSEVGDQDLIGHYRYDDEGVLAERVNLVVDGKLEQMVMSRVPTKKLSGSNGHARRASGRGTAQAAIGCLFVKDDDGVPADELKAKLIEAAQDAGLEFGLRVAAVKAAGIGSSRSDIMGMFMRMQRRGGQQGVGDPIYAYKVYVDDGREELVRGCEFGEIKIRDLKHILAAGNTAEVYNYVGLGFGGATPATSIVAPAILAEELELSKIEQEHDKRPILSSPISR